MPEIATILNKFSTNLKEALKNAQELAIKFNHQEVKPEHVLYALLTQKGSISSEILLSAKIDPQTISDFIFSKNIVKEDKLQLRGLSSATKSKTIATTAKNNVCLSEDVKNAIIKATKTAYAYQHKYIGTEHLLFAILETNCEDLKRLLQKKSVDINKLKTYIINIMDNTSNFPDLREIFGIITGKDKVKEKIFQKETISKNSALNFFGVDITDEKIQNTIDPVIGRDEEIQRIIQILCRRSKNNPILLGEAGVGKTAIVEGLAKKIFKEEVPEILRDKKIYNLDMSLLVSGAVFRGEFEARLKQVIEEVKKDPNIIIFIDEIHTIIGAGSAGGSQDAANILKPALARGEIRCIGATTFGEYRKSIENDPALERRFQPVQVREPTEEKAIEILAGIKRNYELFHNVEITDEAIKTAVKLSKKYLPNKFLPDKAIDLLDEAAAKIKIQQKLSDELIEIKKLSKKLLDIQKQKEKKVLNEEFESALQLKELENALLEELNVLKSREAKQITCGIITKEEIANIISQITQIPVESLTDEEKIRLLDLENTLNKKVVGQEEAIKTISQTIRRSRMGIKNQNRPAGSFMFLGPSGVGKTYLAKMIAETLFGRNSLVRVDMSEFAESFNISKLIGAPAGYIGYQEGGKLSEAIKQKPYSVVLLDEIEKAHPDVINLLLQILDDGHLTDASGKKIDFKNSVIIMTSNIGLNSFNQQASIGFSSKEESVSTRDDELKKHINNELKNSFKKEFLNRLDNVLIFNPLTLKNLEQIVELKIDELNSRIEEKNIKLKLSQKSVKWLAEKNFSANGGAREIERNIAEVENMLAESLLQNKFGENAVVKIDVKNGKLALELETLKHDSL